MTQYSCGEIILVSGIFAEAIWPLKLVLCPTFPGIHERRKVVFQFRDRKSIWVNKSE